MKLNLGIDIDGVLTDEGPHTDSVWQKNISSYLDRKIELQEFTYNLQQAFGLTEDELIGFIEKKLPDVYKNAVPAAEAASTLLNLKEQGHKLILITARDKKFRHLTENWLAENKIPYHELYHEHDKAPLALTKNIDLFIDDNKENALSLAAAGIPVLLVNQYHNFDFKTTAKIKRVNNWSEITKQIELFLAEYTMSGKLS